MPRFFRSRTRRSTVKRTVRRKRVFRKFTRKRMKRPSLSIVRAPSAVADRTLVKLKYEVRQSLSAVAVRSVIKFRGNGIFDPEVALGGTQPLAYDQWSAFYGNWRVHGSSITCRVVTLEGSEVNGFLVVPQTDSTSIATDAALQAPYARSRVLSVSGGNQASIVVRSYMGTKKILGYKSIEFDDNLIGSTGADPVKQWFWSCYYYSLDGISQVDGFMQVKLVYFVEFFNRVSLAES